MSKSNDFLPGRERAVERHVRPLHLALREAELLRDRVGDGRLEALAGRRVVDLPRRALRRRRRAIPRRVGRVVGADRELAVVHELQARLGARADARPVASRAESRRRRRRARRAARRRRAATARRRMASEPASRCRASGAAFRVALRAYRDAHRPSRRRDLEPGQGLLPGARADEGRSRPLLPRRRRLRAAAPAAPAVPHEAVPERGRGRLLPPEARAGEATPTTSTRCRSRSRAGTRPCSRVVDNAAALAWVVEPRLHRAAHVALARARDRAARLPADRPRPERPTASGRTSARSRSSCAR